MDSPNYEPAQVVFTSLKENYFEKRRLQYRVVLGYFVAGAAIATFLVSYKDELARLDSRCIVILIILFVLGMLGTSVAWLRKLDHSNQSCLGEICQLRNVLLEKSLGEDMNSAKLNKFGKDYKPTEQYLYAQLFAILAVSLFDVILLWKLPIMVRASQTQQSTSTVAGMSNHGGPAMTFWHMFTGVFAGIVAGVVISLAVSAVRDAFFRKRMRRYLKFEIEFNIKKIDSFLEELNVYRHNNNADSLHNYFGYFNLSKVLATAVVEMFSSGLIYRYLREEEIGALQTFLADFSLGSEQYMNNRIKWNTSHGTDPGVKQLVNDDIAFWQKKFKENKRMLHQLREKL